MNGNNTRNPPNHRNATRFWRIDSTKTPTNQFTLKKTATNINTTIFCPNYTMLAPMRMSVYTVRYTNVVHIDINNK